MALTQRSIVPGSHVYLFMEGLAFTVPGAGTCGRAAKPGALDPAWLDIGVIEDTEIDRGSEEIKIFAATPGRLRLYDKIETKDELTIKFTTKQLSALAVEIMMKSLALTSASTQFNPLEGAEKRAWLKLEVFDQADAAVMTIDAFVHLKVTGGMKLHGALMEPAFEAAVLHSIYNTGTL